MLVLSELFVSCSSDIWSFTHGAMRHVHSIDITSAEMQRLLITVFIVCLLLAMGELL
jgi:hypothetical protein